MVFSKKKGQKILRPTSWADSVSKHVGPRRSSSGRKVRRSNPLQAKINPAWVSAPFRVDYLFFK